MCFFFNDTATTEIYTLSLHDALPILPLRAGGRLHGAVRGARRRGGVRAAGRRLPRLRSEEHTSELQSHHDLVCRLLLEKKKKSPLHPIVRRSRFSLSSATRCHTSPER